MDNDNDALWMPTLPSFHARQWTTTVDAGNNQQPMRPPPDDNSEASAGQMAHGWRQQQCVGRDDDNDTSRGWPMMPCPSPSPPIHPDNGWQWPIDYRGMTRVTQGDGWRWQFPLPLPLPHPPSYSHTLCSRYRFNIFFFFLLQAVWENSNLCACCA